MQKHFKGDNINELYLKMIEDISTRPEFITSPRGMEIKENIGVTMELTNPRNCLVTFSERKLNYAFAAIEKLEYLSGENNPERLKFYNSNFGNYANKYGSFDGAYPERLKYWYRHIVNLLKEDPDSRQAVISIYGPQDRHESKDIPCTLTLQFLIRNNKLHLIVNMRSNDILWGVPYDTNGFCFILEGIAAMLGIEMGSYILKAGSLHLYTEREEQLTMLTDRYVNVHTDETGTMLIFNSEFDNLTKLQNPIIPKTDFDTMQYNLRKFWMLEEELRTNYKEAIENVFSHQNTVNSLPMWLQDYYAIIREYIESKHNKKLDLK